MLRVQCFRLSRSPVRRLRPCPSLVPFASFCEALPFAPSHLRCSISAASRPAPHPCHPSHPWLILPFNVQCSMFEVQCSILHSPSSRSPFALRPAPHFAGPTISVTCGFGGCMFRHGAQPGLASATIPQTSSAPCRLSSSNPSLTVACAFSRRRLRQPPYVITKSILNFRRFSSSSICGPSRKSRQTSSHHCRNESNTAGSRRFTFPPPGRAAASRIRPSVSSHKFRCSSAASSSERPQYVSRYSW
jgi:hypothetical protein